MKKLFLTVSFVTILGAGCSVGGGIRAPAPDPTTKPEPVVCTMEAKLCPDGSYVGRTAPNCEFSPCPTPAPTTATTVVAVGVGTLTGHLDISPVCPVERVDQPCKPTPAMFAAHPINIYKKSDQTTLVKSLTADASGDFSTSLPADTYYLTTPQSRIGSVNGLPREISIEAGKSVVVNASIDTGIR